MCASFPWTHGGFVRNYFIFLNGIACTSDAARHFSCGNIKVFIEKYRISFMGYFNFKYFLV